MKVFVTGATGFLGSHLVDRLLSTGEDVHVLVRRSSNLRWLLGKKITLHYGDVVGKTKGLEEGIAGADIVYHVAGLIKARRPADLYQVNVQGTINVLETCLKVSPNIKRVVVVTSLAAHGPGPADLTPARETDECHPLTDYGRSKREAEIAAALYKDRLPIAIVRPPAIYGPRDDQIFEFFKMICKGVAAIPAIPGPSALNLAYVGDVVTGLVLAGTHPQAVGETFFIGAAENQDWSKLTQVIAGALGKKPWVLKLPPRLFISAGHVADVFEKILNRSLTFNLAQAQNFIQSNWGLYIGKARKVLGYEPSHSLTQGARETALWYREEEWL